MSEPGTPHSQPGSLDEADQQQLIQQIGRVIMRALPPAWQEASIEYRAVGGYSELAAQLVAPNGTVIPLAVPSEAESLLSQLRHGMHQPGRGTWISALYRVQRAGSYSVDFNGDYEPSWNSAPADAVYVEELTRYPRDPAHIPEWLAQRTGVTAGQRPSLRVAEVFDAETDRQPSVNRPAVHGQERDQVVDYLERAPIVLAARSFDTDQFTPDQSPSVPLTFHTDGNWVWPGAVGYYLRQHGVPPEPELVAHIRERGFLVPEIDENIRENAIALITGETRS